MTNSVRCLPRVMKPMCTFGRGLVRLHEGRDLQAPSAEHKLRRDGLVPKVEGTSQRLWINALQPSLLAARYVEIHIPIVVSSISGSTIKVGSGTSEVTMGVLRMVI